MMCLIRCDDCHKSGIFDFKLDFILESDLCAKCHHHTSREWNYHFCNIACLLSWLRKNEIEEKGIPCRDCCDLNGIPTGHLSGFQSNGTCTTCDGAKRVKGHRLQEWERRITSVEA